MSDYCNFKSFSPVFIYVTHLYQGRWLGMTFAQRSRVVTHPDPLIIAASSAPSASTAEIVASVKNIVYANYSRAFLAAATPIAPKNATAPRILEASPPVWRA